MRAAFEPDAPPAYSLAIVRGPQRGTIVPLVLRETLIGRLDTNHLSFESASLSRIHARLRLTDDGVEIEDLGSREGVVVNGRRISGPRRLEDGDEIVLGDVALVLSSEVARAAPAP